MRQYFSTIFQKIDGSPECNAGLQAACIPEDQARTCQDSDGEAPFMLETDADGTWIALAAGPYGEADVITRDNLAEFALEEDYWRESSALYASYFDELLGTVKLPRFEPVAQLVLVPDPDGVHRLAGPLPEGFVPAETPFLNDTQYIGTLRGDGSLPGLARDLHLCVPIFDALDVVFLDYSDLMAPVYIDPPGVADNHLVTDCGTVERARDAAWGQVNFSVRPSATWNPRPAFGVARRATFVQGPVFPNSPRTGKAMPFLCQFASGVAGDLQDGSIGAVSEPEYFSPDLGFWGGGQVYFYWEEETATLGIKIQNT